MGKKSGAWERLLAFAIFTALGIGYAALLLRVVLSEYGTGFGWMLPWFVLYVLSAQAQIVLHELGHLLTGLAVGYGFNAFSVGPVMLHRQDGKLRVSLHRLAGTAGHCSMELPEGEVKRWQLTAYYFGGAAANLLTAALFVPAMLQAQRGSLAILFFSSMTVVGVLFAVANGLPLSMGIRYNDGFRACLLWKYPVEQRLLQLQEQIGKSLRNGACRLRDMPEQWFPAVEDEQLAHPQWTDMAFLRYERLLDEGRLAEAAGEIDRLLSLTTRMERLRRITLLCDRVYLECVGARRPAVIRVMLTPQLQSQVKRLNKCFAVVRMQYALAKLVRNDLDAARKWKKMFERGAKLNPYPAAVETELDLFALAEEIT